MSLFAAVFLLWIPDKFKIKKKKKEKGLSAQTGRLPGRTYNH